MKKPSKFILFYFYFNLIYCFRSILYECFLVNQYYLGEDVYCVIVFGAMKRKLSYYVVALNYQQWPVES